MFGRWSTAAIVGMFLLPGCSERGLQTSNPEREIVHQLSRHRIVMLGDFAHEWPLSTQTLTTTLTTWLRMLEAGESDQGHLTVFLEEDNQVAGLLRQYLKTGDLHPLLDLLMPSTSLERLESYADLRGIATQIDSLNLFLPASKQIVFDVQGPEAFNVFNPMILDSSDRETRLFYVNQRDSLSAGNVIAYLQDHPDQKALMFYGVGHLIKNFVEKNYTGSLSAGEKSGHYLAYYLKKEFGEDGVFTISQIDHRHSPLQPGQFDSSDVMFLADETPWSGKPQMNKDLAPDNFDAFIVRNQFHIPTHPLSHVFSRRVVAASIKRLEYLEPHQSGIFGSRFYTQALRTLEVLADTNFSTSKEWKSWFVEHPFEGLDHFRSQEFRDRLKEQCRRAIGTPEMGSRIGELISLGFDPRVGSPTMTSGQWDTFFNEMWPQMVILNAIGVCWIGNQHEQERARTYLRQTTGKSFDSPGQFLKWWRKKFYSVSY